MKKIIMLCIGICLGASVAWAGNTSVYLKNNSSTVLSQINQENLTIGPAPALSLLRVVFVVSTKVPNGENIESGQQSTVLHHGGSDIQVVTVELGYGSNADVTMNGRELPSSANINTRALCQGPRGDVHYCTPGETIVGF